MIYDIRQGMEQTDAQLVDQLEAGHQLANQLADAAQKKMYQEFLRLVDRENVKRPIYLGWFVLTIFVRHSKQSQARPKGDKDLVCCEWLVDKLLELGADVNATHCDGRTALLEAVQCRNVTLIKHLLSRGANMKTVSGREQRTIIQTVGCIEIATTDIPISKLFMMNGAKPNEFEVKEFKCSAKLDARRKFAGIMASLKSITCFIGMRNKSPLLKIVGKDVVSVISRFVYQTRGDKVWEQLVP